MRHLLPARYALGPRAGLFFFMGFSNRKGYLRKNEMGTERPTLSAPRELSGPIQGVQREGRLHRFKVRIAMDERDPVLDGDRSNETIGGSRRDPILSQPHRVLPCLFPPRGLKRQAGHGGEPVQERVFAFRRPEAGHEFKQYPVSNGSVPADD